MRAIWAGVGGANVGVSEVSVGTAGVPWASAIAGVSHPARRPARRSPRFNTVSSPARLPKPRSIASSIETSRAEAKTEEQVVYHGQHALVLLRA